MCRNAQEEDAFAHDKRPCSSFSDGAFILLAAANEADPAPIMEKDKILNKHHDQDSEKTQILALQGPPCPRLCRDPRSNRLLKNVREEEHVIEAHPPQHGIIQLLQG